MLPMSILLLGCVFAVMLFTVIYDIRYKDIFLISPLLVWVFAILYHLVNNVGLWGLLDASVSGLFLFVLGLLLYITNATGLGDVFLFWSLGFLVGKLELSILLLVFTMICFIPFLVVYVVWYWKKQGYDITLNGFLRQIPVKDLREGMVLSQSKLWDGLKKEDIEILREAHDPDYQIWIREGIPFTPALLCGLIWLFLIL